MTMSGPANHPATPTGAQTYLWPDLDRRAAAIDAEFVPTALHLVVAPPATVRPESGADPTGPALHLQAHELIERARQEAEQVRRQAREEEAQRARRLADQALRESVEEQVAAFRRAAEELLAQMRQACEERLAKIERQSVTLVTAMTEKVIGRQLEQDDALVLEVVRAALAEAAGAEQVTVHVSPHDDELVRAAQAELVGVLGSVDQLRLVADEGVSRGGCIVETERGRFDARIETQLQDRKSVV